MSSQAATPPPVPPAPPITPPLAPDDHRHRRALTGAAGLIGIFTLLSRLLGLVREMALAWLFHTQATDAFFVAFRLPNLLRELAAEGSMSAGFIPVFTQYLSTRSRQEAPSNGDTDRSPPAERGASADGSAATTGWTPGS